MIRLLITWNIVITTLLAVLLLSNRHVGSTKTPLQTGVTQPDVLRVRRVEIVDQQGRLTMVLGQQSERGRKGLFLLDPDGREAVELGLNDRGYGTLYFQSKQMDAKVSVGYFTENDEVVPLSQEDPGGAWGIRVLRPNLKVPQVFGVQVDDRPIPTSP